MPTHVLRAVPGHVVAGDLPGMVNVHSRAFLRAVAGLAERRARSADGPEARCELAARLAAHLAPDELQAIASQLYVDMLKAGYTQVCEFHALHLRPNGQQYADHAAMSEALIAAADESGIGLTLLPVLYLQGTFAAGVPAVMRRRSALTVEEYLALVADLRRRHGGQCRVGIAFHSLRAVSGEAMHAVLDSGLADTGPIHIPVAAREDEVEAWVQVHGARPVASLLDEMPVDRRWCLVHATHLTASEMRDLAQCGAAVGLCPSSEGNLGIGLFPLAPYAEAGGTFAIGSGLNVRVSAVEELRWLEYSQRAATHSRPALMRHAGGGSGGALWDAAARGGRQAAGLGARGTRSRIQLDLDAPVLLARTPGAMRDSFVFAGDSGCIRDVYVAGRAVVRDFHHFGEARIAQRYRQVLEALALQ